MERNTQKIFFAGIKGSLLTLRRSPAVYIGDT